MFKYKFEIKDNKNRNFEIEVKAENYIQARKRVERATGVEDINDNNLRLISIIQI